MHSSTIAEDAIKAFERELAGESSLSGLVAPLGESTGTTTDADREKVLDGWSRELCANGKWHKAWELVAEKCREIGMTFREWYDAMVARILTDQLIQGDPL